MSLREPGMHRYKAGLYSKTNKKEEEKQYSGMV